MVSDRGLFLNNLLTYKNLCYIKKKLKHSEARNI